MVELVSGAPLNAVMSGGASDTNLGLLGGRQRPNLSGDPNTYGSDNERVSFEGRTSAGTSTPPPSRIPGAGTYGNAPRTIGDARYQFRRNIDLVIAKDTRFGGNHVGQVRFEILNLTNTVKFRGVDSNEVTIHRLRPNHAAGRVHADLAAQLQIHVLTQVKRSGSGAGRRTAWPILLSRPSAFSLLP